MIAEGYAAALADIKRRMNELKAEENALTKAYLDEHRKFNEDDKVSVIVCSRFTNRTETYTAYVRDFHCHEDGTTYYSFSKSKKDGSKSNHKLYIYSGDTVSIELIEPAKATIQ